MMVKHMVIWAILSIMMQLSGVESAESAESSEPEKSKIEGLELRLQQLESGHGGAAPVTVEPLLGTWGCSNGPQSSTLTFFAGGQVLFEEPVLKRIERGSWMRVDAGRIIISGSIRYELRFSSKDEFEFTEMNTRSTGTCHKVP